MHDPGQPREGFVLSEIELVDQHLEAALGASVRVVRPIGIEGPPTVTLRNLEDIGGGHEHYVGISIDEPSDQPRAGDPIGLRTLPCDPLHGSSSIFSAKVVRPSMVR